MPNEPSEMGLYDAVKAAQELDRLRTERTRSDECERKRRKSERSSVPMRATVRFEAIQS